jgi:hypothetical protein
MRQAVTGTEGRIMLRVSTVALFLAAVWSLCVSAQTPPALYTPNLDLTNAAYPREVVRLPDGKIVFASGDLRRVNGVAQSYLTRLNSDGTRDASWNPVPNGSVSGLWVDASGRLYVGGSFTQIAGQPRGGLARFDAAGALDPTRAPTQNSGVNAITGSLAGTVCIGGLFTHFNGTPRNRLACVSDIDGSLINGFVPDVNNTVSTLVRDGNNLYVGGYFTSISSTTRNYAARLPLSGNGTPDAWNPNPNGNVLAVLPNGAGQVFLAGFFGGVNGTSRAGVAKVNDTTGAAITAFNAQMTGSGVLDLLSDGAGGVIAAGSFTAIGGKPRNNIARLDGTSGIASDTFNPNIDYGYAVLLAADGPNYLVGGPFAALGVGEHVGLGRVLANGSVDATFNPTLEAPGYAYVIASLPAPGTFVVGGRFVRANGLIRRNLFKLSSPGVVDPNWNAGTDSEVRAVSTDAIGRVYLGGYFTRVNTVPRPGIARLQATSDGALDPGWNALSTQFAVFSMVLRPEGLYAVGGFSLSGGGTQYGVARLSLSDGSTDSGWIPQFTGVVGAIAATTSGELLVFGTFTAVNGSPRGGAAKLGTGTTATLDPSWAPAFGGGSAGAIAVDNNDVYLGGSFTTINALPRSGLARVSASGSGALDNAWTPSVSASPSKLVARPEGVYVMGTFGSVNSDGHGYLARLDKATGAIDSGWASGANNWVFDLVPHRSTLMTVGWFSYIGNATRQAAARLPVAGDTIFPDDFDG